MFLLVDIVGVQMKEDLGSVGGGDSGSHQTLDLWECGRELEYWCSRLFFCDGDSVGVPT